MQVPVSGCYRDKTKRHTDERVGVPGEFGAFPRPAGLGVRE